MKIVNEPAKRAAALSPASRAWVFNLFRYLGLAPGFMLPPASQVQGQIPANRFAG